MAKAFSSGMTHEASPNKQHRVMLDPDGSEQPVWSTIQELPVMKEGDPIAINQIPDKSITAAKIADGVIPDVSGLATQTALNQTNTQVQAQAGQISQLQTDMGNKADRSEIPDVSGFLSKSGLQQSTGVATDNTMSQDAITKAIPDVSKFIENESEDPSNDVEVKRGNSLLKIGPDNILGAIEEDGTLKGMLALSHGGCVYGVFRLGANEGNAVIANEDNFEILTKPGVKALLNEKEIATVDNIPDVSGLFTRSILGVQQTAFDWSNDVIMNPGVKFVADNANATHRPDGLPVPPAEDEILYHVISFSGAALIYNIDYPFKSYYLPGEYESLIDQVPDVSGFIKNGLNPSGVTVESNSDVLIKSNGGDVKVEGDNFFLNSNRAYFQNITQSSSISALYARSSIDGSLVELTIADLKTLLGI